MTATTAAPPPFVAPPNVNQNQNPTQPASASRDRQTQTRPDTPPAPKKGWTAHPLFNSVIRGSSTTVSVDVKSPSIGRRRETDTDYKGWGGSGSRRVYQEKKSLSIESVRVKLTQKWRGGVFRDAKPSSNDCTTESNARSNAPEKARVDFGVGINLAFATLTPVAPFVCRVKLKLAANDAAPKLTLRLSPGSSAAIVTAVVPLSLLQSESFGRKKTKDSVVNETIDTVKNSSANDRGVCARLEVTLPLDTKRNRKGGGLFLAVKLVRPEGKGISLSTNGVELDFPNLLNIDDTHGDAFKVRINGSVDFPRDGMGTGRSRLREDDEKYSSEIKNAHGNQPVRLSLRKLGVKKVTRWWTRAGG